MFKKDEKKKANSQRNSQLPENIFEELKSVNINLNKQNSFKRNFSLSVVQGVGSAIGATIFAGIAIAVLYKIIVTIDALPLIEKLLPQSAVEQLVNPSPKK